MNSRKTRKPNITLKTCTPGLFSKQIFCKLLNYALSLTQDLTGAHKTMCRQAEIHKHKYTLTG